MSPVIGQDAYHGEGDPPHAKAVEILLREHRQLASMLIVLQRLVADVVAGRQIADFGLLASILGYVDGFPDHFHHPKEEKYLFAALRRRTTEADLVLERLTAEHHESDTLTVGLMRCFIAFQAQVPGADTDFANACLAYARFHVEHMQFEEGALLPLAIRHLRAPDWQELTTAFSANLDAWRGGESCGHFEVLRQRILDGCPDDMVERVWPSPAFEGKRRASH